MKQTSTIKKLCVVFLFTQFLLVNSRANPPVYCEPTFASGCFNWHNQEIYLESINWIMGGNLCSDYDYTSTTTTLNAGSTYPMTVTSGVWCGCSVWIDFDQNDDFDATENLYHEYQGGDPGYTYNFNIAIPSNVPTGTYRMRVVAAWGSDGFTVGGSNGYGPCGSFQYGNFTDLSVDVIGAVGIPETSDKSLHILEVNPNPATSVVTVLMNAYRGGDATLTLTDMAGKIVHTVQVTQAKEELDFNLYAKGIYFLQYKDGLHDQIIRIVR